MNSPITENELQRAISRYFAEYTDEQRIELVADFVSAQPALAYSLDFPEEENFDDAVRTGVCNFAAIIHLLFKDRLDMPEVSDDDITSAYKKFEGMLRYINGDAETEEEVEVENLYPEPVLLRHFRNFIIEHYEYLSKVQHYDIFLALGAVVDVYAQAKKRYNEAGGGRLASRQYIK